MYLIEISFCIFLGLGNGTWVEENLRHRHIHSRWDVLSSWKVRQKKPLINTEFIFNSLIHFFRLGIVGRKECNSWTEKLIPRWPHLVSFLFCFACQWLLCSYGIWRRSLRGRSSSSFASRGSQFPLQLSLVDISLRSFDFERKKVLR